MAPPAVDGGAEYEIPLVSAMSSHYVCLAGSAEMDDVTLDAAS